MNDAAVVGDMTAPSWLGQLPIGWAAKRLKYLSTINDETLPETTDPDYELLYVDIGSVDGTEGIQKKEPMIFETAPSRARRVVRDGDTILSTVRTYLRAVAPIQNPEQNLIVSTGFAVVRPKGIDPRYLAYCLRSSYFIETVVSRSVGVSYPATNPTEVSCIELPVPPLEEQQAIARFLDAKTEQIDALVAQKRQLIDKLKEKRQTLIARTVTRGLPPDAAKAAGLEPNPEIRDSGVEWLGAVPARWKVKAIKWESPVQRGASPRPIDDPIYFDDDGEYAWVRISDVTAAGMYLENTEQRLSDLGSSLSVKMQPGSLFLSIAGTVGKPCIANIKCCIHDGFVYFPRWKGDSRFLFYIFASGEPYKGLGKMGTQLNLNTDTVGSILIGVPHLKEQKLIADYLDKATAELDSMTATVGAAIERLVEYRQAVISSAVIGKIDVRGLA